MKYSVADAVGLLARTPICLTGLLSGLPDGWAKADEGPGTWSPFEVVGHLIHGENTDWISRTEIILQHGESVPFEPFDRFAQSELYADWALDDLLAEFGRLRMSNMERLLHLAITDEQLDKTGHHPEFGTVTLRNHLATWVTHDYSHIAQICRVMAKQYSDEVGPWTRYIGILNS